MASSAQGFRSSPASARRVVASAGRRPAAPLTWAAPGSVQLACLLQVSLRRHEARSDRHRKCDQREPYERVGNVVCHRDVFPSVWRTGRDSKVYRFFPRTISRVICWMRASRSPSSPRARRRSSVAACPTGSSTLSSNLAYRCVRRLTRICSERIIFSSASASTNGCSPVSPG